MSRIGFKDNAESADIVKEISQLPNLDTEGLFTHFADRQMKQIRHWAELQLRDVTGVCTKFWRTEAWKI